ncbi:MAG: O-antigen ligase family protein, partial [Candidatus Dojkabacteria bacterium]|nr:O-antigen ligase family protein [Candidatus Dojkabacteria bacterium]
MIKKVRIFISVILLFVIITPIIFWGESPAKAISIAISLLLLALMCLITKKPALSSLLYILLILPFNITFQLNIVDPYVNGVYVNYLVPTLSILDLAIVVFLFASFIELGYKRIKDLFKKHSIWLILLFLFLLVQNIFLKDYLSIFNSLRIILYSKALIVGIFYLNKENRNYLGRGILYILLFTIIIQGVLGIIQFTRGSSLGLGFLGESQVVSGMQGSSFVTLNYELFLRAYGTFPHPNIFAGFFVLSTMLLLFIQRHLTKTQKIISFILIFLISIFTLFTFSRLCIILLGMILLVYFSRYIFRKKLISFTVPLFLERFLNLFSGLDSSLQDRINLIKASFNVIRENILLGTGIGNFVRGMKEYVPRTYNGIQLLQPVHNIPLLWVSELGVLGSLLYIGLIVDLLRKNI